jgi:hypothetical protein
MAANVPNIEVGDVVIFKDNLCMCILKEPTKFGWNEYIIQDIFTDEIFRTTKHRLTKVDFESEIPLPEEEHCKISASSTEPKSNSQSGSSFISIPTVIPQMNPSPDKASNVVTTVENDPCTSNKKPRFDILTEEELNGLANERLSEHTKQQTKWAVKLFRGE